jgi:hypothetical protein
MVQPLDVREHPHGRIVPSERGERPCSVRQTRLLYVCGSGRESAGRLWARVECPATLQRQ